MTRKLILLLALVYLTDWLMIRKTTIFEKFHGITNTGSRWIVTKAYPGQSPISILSSKDLDDVPINQLVAELEFVQWIICLTFGACLLGFT